MLSIYEFGAKKRKLTQKEEAVLDPFPPLRAIKKRRPRRVKRTRIPIKKIRQRKARKGKKESGRKEKRVMMRTRFSRTQKCKQSSPSWRRR